MFTGIIEAVGKIQSIRRSGRHSVLTVDCGPLGRELSNGDSIAVNGTCLTVTSHTATQFTADLSIETLKRTTFVGARAGQKVNLERPLATNARLGGHFVQGHVDGVGKVAGVRQEGETLWMAFGFPEDLAPYFVEKGSVAIDGVSLTIASLHEDRFEIAVIPFTAEHTNLGRATVGDPVNLECDILAKYLRRFMDVQSGRATAPDTIEPPS